MEILAVDDDEYHRDLLSLALKEMSYTDSTICSSGQEALTLIADRVAPFDCFLLDIEMPGMSGIELCAKIRENPKNEVSPIVMLTALSGREHVEAAFAAGASDYMTKPFDQVELKARLQLAKKHRMENLRFARMRAKVEDMRTELSEEQNVTISTPFRLDDVACSIEYLAFENYLLRISSDFGGAEIVSVKIGNVASFYHNASISEFRFVINSVGDSISEALQFRKFFLTYAGNGVFPILLLGGFDIDVEAFETDLSLFAEEIEIIARDGKLIRPQLFVGSGKRTSFIPQRASLSALVAAVDDVEQLSAVKSPESPLARNISVAPWKSLLGFLRAS